MISCKWLQTKVSEGHEVADIKLNAVRKRGRDILYVTFWEVTQTVTGINRVLWYFTPLAKKEQKQCKRVTPYARTHSIVTVNEKSHVTHVT